MAASDKPKPPSHTEKTLSIRIPEEKHRTLKGRCVMEGVSLRSVLLAVIDELENETPTVKKILDSAKDSDKNTRENGA